MSAPFQLRSKKPAKRSTEIGAQGPQLPALAQQVEKLEAVLSGIIRLLKARRPDLAAAIDEVESDFLGRRDS